jgi:hypothetical protein
MKRKFAPDYLRAAFVPDSFNEEERTIEVVFATEAEVLRRNWDGNFYEILQCDVNSVRLERLNAGGPVLNAHSKYDLNDQIGVVERAWVEKKECKAILRFSKREEIAGLIEDIKSGIVRGVSVGYRPYTGEETKGIEGAIPKIRMTDWEPMEISMVPVPADFMSGTRSADSNELIEVEITRKNKMEDGTKEEVVETRSEDQGKTTPPAKVVKIDVEAVRAESATAERNRSKEIKLAVRSAGLEDSFAETHIDAGTEVAEVRTLVLAELAKKQEGTQTRGAVNINTGKKDEEVSMRAAMEEVILHRSNPGVFKLETEEGHSLRNATIVELAAESLKERGITVSFRDSKEEIVKRAMSSTDFPILLGNVANRVLRTYYEAVPSFWKKFAREISVNDFKAISSVQFGGSIGLEEILEGGEYKIDVLKEGGDSFGLKTWGKMIALTRRAIINDDMGGFMRSAEMFGRGAAEKQNAIVWSLFTANNGGGRKLADNVNLFHASHNNLAGTGSVLSADSLNAARVAMTRQKGLKGEPISIRPAFLVVPPELEFLAKQLINSTIVPNSTSQANPLQGMFEVVVDVYLTDPKAWYLVSDAGMVDVIKYATLNGQTGLYTDQQVDFKTDNLEIKARVDFNATIEEYRGVYKNAGPA